MKAIVFHGIGDIRLDDVAEPRIEAPTDAILGITASAICGTDLHMIRGTMPGMKPGTVLGHEAVGVIEEVGPDVRNLAPGDRVVVPSTIACGACETCRDGEYAQCEVANPNGPEAGTAFFGGPEATGPFHGLQAERARIPFANVGPVKLPREVSDDQAIMLSDIFPTGWYGADLADVRPGSTVCVLGCGPVGLFAIVSARLMGAGRIFAIDCLPDRLEAARALGAETIDYDHEDPVETVKRLTRGKGVDCVIEAVGVDANRPHHGAAHPVSRRHAQQFDEERKTIAPETKVEGGNWHPGDAPSQALQWAVKCVRRAGTVAIVGVYPETASNFPIGEAMQRNLRLRMGNCNHRAYIPKLLQLVEAGIVDPAEILTQRQPLMSALDAYRHFDQREPDWVKVELQPVQ